MLQDIGIRSLEVEWMIIALTIIGGIVATFLYWLMFVPLNRIRDLTDIGYGHLQDSSKRRGMRLKDLVNETRALRKSGTLPPIYPNGWFAIVESKDLKNGVAKPVSALGENFAVFRGEDGKVHILDAYCPHLGAHLAIGGQVKGNCIECPFHGWRFSGQTGECVHIPYTGKVPSFAKVKKWTSWEGNGFIFCWYHAENVEPTWYPPEQITSGDWRYSGRTEHYINAHIQDVPENGGDVNHLPQVHNTFMFAGVDLNILPKQHMWDFAQHFWSASWKENDPPNSHTATMSLKHTMCFFGKIRLFEVDVQAKQIGPGLVHLEIESYFGSMVLVQTVTPVGPMLQKVVHHLYAAKSVPMPYSKFALLGEAIMVERDIMVWNHKTYVQKPVLVKEDRMLGQHRRWYSQFYSENSPRLTFAKDTNDW